MNNKSWRTWKSCVKNTFTHNGKHLKRPLGNWLSNSPSQNWQTYRAMDEYTLFMAPSGKNPTWEKYESLRVTPNGIQYEEQLGAPCNSPKSAYKISLSSTTKYPMIYTDAVSLPVPLQPQQLKPPLIIDKAILRLLGPEIRQISDQQILAQSLSDRTLQGAMDGSMKLGQGTCAWRIEAKTIAKLSDNNIIGAAPVDGDPSTMNSTRA